MAAEDRTKILQPGEGERVIVMGDPFTYKLVDRDSGGAYSLVEVDVALHGPPPHIHANEDEGFYVVHGVFDIRIGERVVRASQGAFVFGPRGIVHTYTKVGDEPAKLLEIFSPAGFERFFQEIQGLSDFGQIRAVAQRFDLAIVGPPGPVR